MILTQGKLAQGLFDEICNVIDKYDETLYVSTVLGVIELVKAQIMSDAMEEEDDPV